MHAGLTGSSNNTTGVSVDGVFLSVRTVDMSAVGTVLSRQDRWHNAVALGNPECSTSSNGQEQMEIRGTGGRNGRNIHVRIDRCL